MRPVVSVPGDIFRRDVRSDRFTDGPSAPTVELTMDDRFTTFVENVRGVIEEFLYDDGMLGTVLAFVLVFGGAAVVLMGIVLLAGLLA